MVNLLMPLIGGLLLLPIAALFVFALAGFEASTLVHLANTVLAETATTSLILAVGTLTGALVMGVGAAWCVERYRFPLRNWLAWMLVLPLAMPTYVIAYAYTDLLQFSGPVQHWLRLHVDEALRLPDIRSLWGAVLLFSFVLYPYVYLLTRTALSDISGTTVDSARLLGCRGPRLFRRLVLPLILPSAVAGAMLVLMETLADVGATYYFGLQTFSAGIYKTWFALGDRDAALLLAIVLLMVIALIYHVERRARGRAERASNRTFRPWLPQALSPASGLSVMLALLVPVLIGFVIPVVALVHLLVEEPEITTNLDRVFKWGGNSLLVGVIAATLTTALALGFAFATRFADRARLPLLNWTAGALKFGYAVPGAVIALAILWPVAMADRAISDALALRGSLITNTIAVLIYAYMLRFFAVAFGGIEASFGRVTGNLDAAARTLGASRAAVFAKIHLPLIRRSAVVAWMLVLIDTMKELPATLMLRPFNFDTLAVIAQQLSADERLAEAALPSLAIVAIGLIPVIFVSRLLMHHRGAQVAWAGAGAEAATLGLHKK